ncbi:MAG: hypothetical protein Q9188_000794 [Gyalolechia gomerana]
MASISKSNPKDITKCSSVLVFAAKLERTLREAVDTLPSLTASLHENIEKVDLIYASATATKNRDLDGRGTTIWNLTSKHKDDVALAETLALARAFACLLLDCAQQSEPGAAASKGSPLLRFQAFPLIATIDDIRVLKITLKASKWCLDKGQLGVAEKVIERAAFYEQRLQRRLPNKVGQALAPTSRQLASQYHILRIALAWRRERLDLADFFFAKLNAAGTVHNTVAEELADILFEIGRNQATKQSYSTAIQWLERAHDTLISQIPEDLSTDASALRGCIVHTLVHALLKQRSEENNLRAWKIIQELEKETDNPITVSLLKLQVLTGDQSPAQDYHEILVQVIRQIHLSDLNVKTILHHVHELRRRSARLAHTALAALLSERLLAINEIAWVEKTLITILWNCTTSTDPGDMTDQLEELLSQVASRPHSSLTTSATHAAQIALPAPKPVRADRPQATACLDAISAGSETDFTLLYACVLEAQKNGNRLTVIRALSRVLDKRNYATSPGLHSATLLRTTARLLIEELESQQSQEVDCSDELCKVFEAGQSNPET